MARLLPNYNKFPAMLQNGGEKRWLHFARHKTLQGPNAPLFSLLLTLATKRRRQLIALSLISLVRRGNSANLATARSVKRSCQMLKRNIGWWKTVSSTYSASRFKKTFRISRGTFDFILEKIRHRHQRETKTEDPFGPEERLAICLYRLARGDYYFTVSEMVFPL